jgi:hypothetical protein
MTCPACACRPSATTRCWRPALPPSTSTRTS